MLYNADKTADRIQQQALAAQSAFFDLMRDDLALQLLEARKRDASVLELLQIANEVLTGYADPLAGLLADAAVASWLLGFGGVLDQIPGGGGLRQAGGGFGSPPSNPPTVAGFDGGWDWQGMRVWLPLIEEAAESIRERRLLSRPEFDQLADDAKARAFTVAGLFTHDALASVRDALVESIEEGPSLGDFRERVEERLGESALSPGHMENVYRTNVQTAYSDGKDAVLDHWAVSDLFPFEETVPIDDSRLTELCAVASRSGIEGTGIYLRDDPTWRRLKPPRHWNCRCARIALTVEDAAARGLRYAQKWLEQGRQPLPPAYVPMPAVQFPKGWSQRAYSLTA